MRFDIPAAELVPILEDLVLYDSAELARSAAALMVRFYNQQQELQDALQNVQILVTERNVSTYEFVASQLNELRHLLGSFSASSCDPIVRILRALKNLCVKYNTPFSHNQRILRNLDAHTVVFELLRAPFDPRAPGTVAARHELAESVFDLLGAFCLENADNQACLFEYLDEFLRLLPDYQSVAATLAQVFRNNRSLCSQLTEGQLRKIVNTIASGCRFPRFLRLLETLTMVNGRPVRRNQTLVLKMLMEQQADTLVLFNDPESAQERNRLIREGDFRQNPNSVLMYHRLLIDLITSCAAGKIYEAEIKAQALYSVHDIAQHLVDSENLR
ncbi:MAG TPA: hypothetical protein VJB16_00285, partial [archaeon]|nr:hypothetical protein [archaeon]